jgi:hypothetical protein
MSHLPSRATLGRGLSHRLKQHPIKSKPLSRLISSEIYTTAIFSTQTNHGVMHSEIPKKS